MSLPFLPCLFVCVCVFCFDATFTLLQRRVVLLPTSHRPYQGRDVGSVRAELAQPGGGPGKYRARHVPARTDHHSGHPRGDIADRHWLAVRCQTARDSLHLRMPRRNRQLHRLHDVLSRLPVAYIRGTTPRVRDTFLKRAVRALSLSPRSDLKFCSPSVFFFKRIVSIRIM